MPFKFGMGQGQGQGRAQGQGCGCGCNSRGAGVHTGAPHTCVCSSCGREVTRLPGDPCQEGRCPHCGGEMARKG
ncbi:MAG: hypothetical protein C4567_06920 [Deltaproteobacteria bacterium]|nr:MAG: hypothetical protein C4567_06920 [Deltaproteobacteria bacterium]